MHVKKYSSDLLEEELKSRRFVVMMHGLLFLEYQLQPPETRML